MTSDLRYWPNWLRWFLLLPASMLGGFIAGVLLELINSLQAASSKAPILYIAAFLGGLASIWVALYIAYSFAPTHKRIVILVLLAIAVLGDASVVHLILRAEEYRDLCRVIGSLVGCFVFWREYGRKRKREQESVA